MNRGEFSRFELGEKKKEGREEGRDDKVEK